MGDLKDVNGIKQFEEKVKGKVAVLFGQYMIGKTLLALQLARNFKNPLILKIDTNYPAEYYEISKATIKDIQNQYSIINEIKNIPKSTDLVVIDSITSLQSMIVGEKMFSPRAYLEYNNLCDWIAKKLGDLKKIQGLTSILIAHERLKDWESKEVVPRVNQIMLRHIDVMFRMVREDNGDRVVKLVFERKVDQVKPNYKFEFQ